MAEIVIDFYPLIIFTKKLDRMGCKYALYYYASKYYLIYWKNHGACKEFFSRIIVYVTYFHVFLEGFLGVRATND